MLFNRLIMLVIVVVMIIATTGPAMAMTADCYEASAIHNWLNISANMACFMAIIMNGQKRSTSNLFKVPIFL